MSFNIRNYSWHKIENFASMDDFENFESWILKPDARIFEDDVSGIFINFYCNSNKEDRRTIYNSIANGKSYILDMIKFIKVVNNINNKPIHKNSLEKYTLLFQKKWKNHLNKI